MQPVEALVDPVQRDGSAHQTIDRQPALTIQGDIAGDVALFRQGRLPVDRLLTGTIALSDINAAFDDLHDGKAVRTVVTFG